jgi:hypothetical protein
MGTTLKLDRFNRLFVEHRMSCSSVADVSVISENMESAVLELSCSVCHDRLRETFTIDEAIELRRLLEDTAGFLRGIEQTEKRSVD